MQAIILYHFNKNEIVLGKTVIILCTYCTLKILKIPSVLQKAHPLPYT